MCCVNSYDTYGDYSWNHDTCFAAGVSSTLGLALAIIAILAVTGTINIGDARYFVGAFTGIASLIFFVPAIFLCKRCKFNF